MVQMKKCKTFEKPRKLEKDHAMLTSKFKATIFEL